MNNSLREQMLKAGLVSKKQAKKSEQQTKLKKRKQPKKASTTVDEDSVAYLAIQKQKEEIARTKELNRLKEEKRLQKELQAQVRDIIRQHRVNKADADLTYNFIAADKLVKQILVTNKQQQQLTNGYLAIASLDDSYHLIPAPIAEKLLERIPEIVVCYNNTPSDTDEDDPYADYKIPDDLMW